MHKLVAAVRFSSIFVYVICCLIIITFVLPFSKQQTRGRVIRRWARRLVDWLGVKLVIEGKLEDERAQDCGLTPDVGGRLLCANHVSVLDIFVLNAIAPSSFVAKAEIARWPVFGRIASAVDTVFIERGNKRALLGVGSEMQRALKEGRNLLLFPEGTTSDGTGLLRLHGNLMEAAVKMHAPVVPIVLRYRSGSEVTTNAAYTGSIGLFECVWRILNTKDFWVQATILEPMYGENRHELCRRVSATMCAHMGVPDPMAAVDAVHGTPAVQPVTEQNQINGEVSKNGL